MVNGVGVERKHGLQNIKLMALQFMVPQIDTTCNIMLDEECHVNNEVVATLHHFQRDRMIYSSPTEES